MIPEKITLKYLEDQIESVEHIFDESGDDKWVLCVITVANGYKIEGIAHRQFSMGHNRDIAKSAAYQEAVNNMWSYYTFLSHYKYNHKDVQKSKQFPKKIKLGARYKIGLELDEYAETYIFAQVDKQVFAFISLNDGNRWSDPIELTNYENGTMRLTEKEWNSLTKEGEWKEL